MLYGINFLLLLYVGGKWSSEGFLDGAIKTVFLGIAVVNAIFFALFLDIRYPWVRSSLGF